MRIFLIPLLFALSLFCTLTTPAVAQQTVCTYLQADGATKNCVGTQDQANTITILTDVSGAVTTGGTSQQVFAGTTTDRYRFCQNPITATEALYINIGTAASTTTGNSYELAPGSTLSFTHTMPGAAWNVTAVTTGHKFVCKRG